MEQEERGEYISILIFHYGLYVILYSAVPFIVKDAIVSGSDIIEGLCCSFGDFIFGDDSFGSGAGNDIIQAGNDVIYGSDSNDTLLSANGVITGGGGYGALMLGNDIMD